MLGVMAMKHCAEDRVDLTYTLSIGTFRSMSFVLRIFLQLEVDI